MYKLRPVFAAQREDTEVEDRGEASEEDKAAAAKSGEEIYIGFDKSDGAPRKGRKGRVLNDDPSRYPARDELSGGWAGGEIGLRKFVEEEAAKGETYQKARVVESNAVDGKLQQKAITEDGEEIYLGFSKSEMEQRKQGGRGRSIRDDPSRYPDKEDVGILPQVTGGFAGGEMGVKQFVESGDIKLSPKGKAQFSPVALAIFVIFGVSTGAILLNSGVLLSEQALGGGGEATSGGPLAGVLSSSLTDSLVVDEKTKLLLNATFAVLGLGAVLIGGRAVSKRLQESTSQLKDDAVNAAKISVFVLVTLLGVLYVLDY